MTTTILGANGKLGSMLSRFASGAGVGWKTQARTGATDSIWSGNMDDPAADAVFVAGATLINLIGHTGTDQTQLHDGNVRFVHDLLTEAMQTGVAHVVLFSSAAVYGAGDGTPFKETAPLQPVSPYGASKVAMEDAALTFAAQNGAPAITILRVGNVCGADALILSATRHIATGTAMPLHRFKDGAAPLRSYIGPRDLFDVVRACATPQHGPPRILNVTYPQPVALDAVLRAYRANLMPDLRWVDTAAPHGTLPSVTLSADQVQQFVTFQKYDDPATAMARQVAGLPDQ